MLSWIFIFMFSIMLSPPPPDGVIQYHEEQSPDPYILGIAGQVQHLQLDEGQSSNSQPDLMNIL